jgi:hypothetical protein
MKANDRIPRTAVVFVLLALLLGVACGSPGDDTDAADTLDDATTETPHDVPSDVPQDMTPPEDGFSPDSPGPDGGPCATDARCAQPPPGYALCGEGTLDPATMSVACATVDPPLDLYIGLEKDCAALSPVRGRFEVYCGPEGAYVWVLLEEVTSTALNHCSVTVPLPDGGTVTGEYDRLSWDLRGSSVGIYFDVAITPEGGTAMNYGGSGFMVTFPFTEPEEPESPELWRGQWGFGARLSTAGTSGAAAGALYVTASQVDCDGIPAGTGTPIVLAVPLSWTVP